MSARILMVDDDHDILQALELLFEAEGFRVRSCSEPAQLLPALAMEPADLILLDMNFARDTTSGGEGLELLAVLSARFPRTPVIVMTAWASVETAVAALQKGARDYIQKPWDNSRLLQIVRTELELSWTRTQNLELCAENARLYAKGASGFVARSPAMHTLLRLGERVAASNATVLITGEHGAGKEVLARYIHALSSRRERPFVPVHAGSIVEGLFESELFGHIRGAFTDARADRAGAFEQAHGGTLFLDEVATMPLSQQAKLLRVLQTGEYTRVGATRTLQADARVIAATNVDLRAEVAAGRFREDLYYRLNAVELRVPPLRERREDILPLALATLESAEGRRLALSEGARQALLGHAWPGNVRELEHVVYRALILADGEVIEVHDLKLEGRVPHEPQAKFPDFDTMTLDEIERFSIERALERTQGNVAWAAQKLGLSRSALYRRLERHGISPAKPSG